MSKVCTKCGKEFLRTAKFFYKDKQKKDGLRPECKGCRNRQQKIYRDTEYGILVHKVANAKYKKTGRGKFINWRSMLKRKYNLTVNSYDKLSVTQNNLCAICHNPETVLYKGSLKILCVDHCHTTGKVRGLLCSRCNKAIGLLEDDMSLLLSAVKYLRSNK